MTQVSLVGFASAGAFQNLAFFDLYFHLIAIIFLAQRIVIAELEKVSPAAETAPERQRSPVSHRPLRSRVTSP
jgi:hypothetical protein